MTRTGIRCDPALRRYSRKMYSRGVSRSGATVGGLYNTVRTKLNDSIVWDGVVAEYKGYGFTISAQVDFDYKRKVKSRGHSFLQHPPCVTNIFITYPRTSNWAHKPSNLIQRPHTPLESVPELAQQVQSTRHAQHIHRDVDPGNYHPGESPTYNIAFTKQ